MALPQMGGSRPSGAGNGSEGATLNLSDSYSAANSAQQPDAEVLFRQMGQAFQRNKPMTSGQVLAPRMFQPILPMNSGSGASISAPSLPINSNSPW